MMFVGDRIFQELRELSDGELIELFLSLYETVYVLQCYSPREYNIMIAAEEELVRRGYRIVRRVEVRKGDEEGGLHL